MANSALAVEKEGAARRTLIIMHKREKVGLLKGQLTIPCFAYLTLP